MVSADLLWADQSEDNKMLDEKISKDDEVKKSLKCDWFLYHQANPISKVHFWAETDLIREKKKEFFFFQTNQTLGSFAAFVGF